MTQVRFNTLDKAGTVVLVLAVIWLALYSIEQMEQKADELDGLITTWQSGQTNAAIERLRDLAILRRLKNH